MKHFYLLVIIFCLLNVRAIAMEQYPPIPEGKQEVEEIEQQLEDEQKIPTDIPTITVQFSNYLRQSKTIDNMVGDLDDERSNEFELTMSKRDFDTIQPLLKMLFEYSQNTDGAQSDSLDRDKKVELEESLKNNLIEYTLSDLISLLNAADYLDVPLILEVGVEIYDQKIIDELNALSPKELVQYLTLIDNWLEELNLPVSMHTKLNAFMKKQVNFFTSYEVPVTILKDHTKAINSVCFSPDGKLVVSASDDKTIKVRDIASGNCKTLTGHTRLVKHLSFNPDGTQFASASYDGTVKLWDVSTGVCVRTLMGLGCINFVGFSPDGKHMSSVSFVRDMRNYREIALAEIRVWEVATGNGVGALYLPRTYINDLSFTRDSKQIAFVSNSTIRLWNFATNNCEEIVKNTRRICNLSFSPDGKYIAFGLYCGDILLWDVESRTCIKKLKGHTASISSLQFSHDGTLLASASGGGAVRLWDVKTGICLKKLTGVNKNRGNSVSFNPDDTQLISSKGCKIKWWDIGVMFSALNELTLPQTMLLYKIEKNCVNATDISTDYILNDQFESLDPNIKKHCARCLTSFRTCFLTKIKPSMPSIRAAMSGVSLYKNAYQLITGDLSFI